MYHNDHRCKDCNKVFDLLSRTWAEQENSKCPNCKSTNTKRIISKTPIINSRGIIDYTKE